MKVLAIDPGERVGWARAEVRDVVRLAAAPHDIWAEAMVPSPKPVPVEPGRELVLEDHGISGLRDFAIKLHEVYATYDVVVFEEYRISADKRRLHAHIGSDVPTLQLIGIIRGLSWLHPDVKLVKQRPADKPTAIRSMNHPAIELALRKLPKSHDDSHDGDALLHLWHWYWKNHV